MRRVVESELLDLLPFDDPRAARSRADIRRLNTLMGHAGILTRAFQRHAPSRPGPGRPLRIVELGGGDGTFLTKLARRWSALGIKAEVIVIDRHPVLSAATCEACATVGWQVRCLTADVFDGLEQLSETADVMLANLFLHHFEDEALHRLLTAAAARTRLFLACEPCRSRFALLFSHLLGLIGCNSVTRYDAVVSVRAGFAGKDLAALWPADQGWRVKERSAGLFSHLFVAARS